MEKLFSNAATLKDTAPQTAVSAEEAKGNIQLESLVVQHKAKCAKLETMLVTFKSCVI